MNPSSTASLHLFRVDEAERHPTMSCLMVGPQTPVSISLKTKSNDDVIIFRRVCFCFTAKRERPKSENGRESDASCVTFSM